MTLKKKRFQLLSSQTHVGFRAVRVDRTKQGQLLWVASSSLSILKTSVGAPGIQLPREVRATRCRSPFLSLGKSTEALKYCPERPRGFEPQLLPTPPTPPRSSSPWWARVHVTPSTPVPATPAPSRRGTTAWRAPKRFISVVSIMVVSIQGAGTSGLRHSLRRSWAPSA